jgi:hypothetical protein
MLISRRILDAAYRLDGLRLAEPGGPPAPAEVKVAAAGARSTVTSSGTAEHAETQVVPIESLIEEADVVPIESLLLEELVVPIESLAYDEPVGAEARAREAPAPVGGLEGSYRTFDRLRRERGAETPSLEALVGRALAAVVPALSEGTVTVEIGALCYRGRAALERAAAVRQQLADELARNGGLDAIQPLLQELLDLVPLALAES